MRSVALNILKTTGVYLVLCIGTFLMARTILSYTSMDEHVGFLNEKQAYLPNTVWKTAFYAHVFSSIFCLIAGFTQFSRSIQSRHVRIHRLIGKWYVITILVNFPVALIMAYYANGFLPSKIAFFLLDILWLGFTVKAFLAAKQRNFREHEQFMIRSYALTFSAVTLRTWKLVLSHTFTIDPVTLYMIDAWLGFVPNLLVAEYLIRRRFGKRLPSEIEVDQQEHHRDK